MRRVRVSRERRLVLAVGGAVGVVLLAGGCGIRPTAVPVDAGPPASRSACPSPLRPPAAVPGPTAGEARDLAVAAGPAGSSPVPSSPSGTVSGGSVFSALPSPSPSPSSTGPLHCE